MFFNFLGGEFSPKNLPSLQLWLDASDTSTITESSGSVSAWADKSGRGNSATQGTEANQPTTGSETMGGKNVLTFDASTDDFMTVAHSTSLQFDSGTGYTIFWVGEFDGYLNQTSSLNLILSKGAGVLAAAAYNIQVNSGNKAIFQSGNNEIIQDDSGTFNTVPSYITCKMSNATTTAVIQRNGGASYTNATATVGSNNTDNLTIGGGTGSTIRYAGGKYAEILIYSRLLSVAEATAVENYVSNKWGI